MTATLETIDTALGHGDWHVWTIALAGPDLWAVEIAQEVATPSLLDDDERCCAHVRYFVTDFGHRVAGEVRHLILQRDGAELWRIDGEWGRKPHGSIWRITMGWHGDRECGA